MDDEFALCWNNFQDNIASGFQNLFDRGYLVDVTLACDGKLLQAHKIVLAICSPYFQEMFIANPCKHPIIVLKDISSTVMTELLQFMYQGVVNVKHTELSTFMKIAQTLQIKGLATSSTSKSFNQSHNQDDNERMSDINEDMQSISRKAVEHKMNMSTVVNAKTDNVMAQSSSSSAKRSLDYEHFNMNSKKQMKRFSEVEPHNLNNASMELSNSDDAGLPPVPQISMVESRFDINNVKREVSEMPGSPGSARSSAPSHFNFDYNVYQSRNIEYPNELHAENDFKGGNNYNDIPAGSNITMLTSTSLLHGNCIFNRNNTVATQQGMKTYWLCKSYRITMCRARCITHQGRIISATGVHNHQPHMKSSTGNEFFNPFMHGGSQQAAGNDNPSSAGPSGMSGPPNMRIPQNANSTHSINNQQQQHLPFHSSQQYSSGYHQMHYPSELQGQHNYSPNNAAVLQNMMQNVLSQNNLMHLTNMAPMLNPLSQYSSSAGNSSNNGTKMPLPGDYSNFQQAGRNSDDSHILDSQNVSNTAAAVDSSNRGGICANFTNNNNNNSNNKSTNGNEIKDNANSETVVSINSNNNNNQNNNPTAISNNNSNNNNNNNNNANNSGGNGSNNNSGKNSSNNSSSESIYYGGDSNSNNNENISNSEADTPVGTVVDSTNSNNSNNNSSNVNSDSTNANNAGSNNENSNNSIRSTNNNQSNGRAIRPTVNTSVMPVNNNCENVPQISNDLAETNLISISPSQMTFKIERT